MQEQENTQSKYSILVIDPDAEFANMVAQAITDAASSYSVTVDTDPQQALAHVHRAHATQRPFDLLIADVRTPGADSMHMIEELAESYPELKIATMTAYHSPELAARMLKLNVYSHLVKPVAPSRIRQLVHNALAGKVFDTDLASFPPPLSNVQQTAVERQLANLRRATGSTAALLVHASGTVRAIDCLESDLDADVLSVALMDAQRSIAQALAQTTQAENPIRQCYFGTASYSVCVHRLDETHAVVTIFGPEVREGQVWYAIREGTKTLQEALDTRDPASPPQRISAQSDGFAMVERYFAQQTRSGARARSRRSTREHPPLPPTRETPASAKRASATPTPATPTPNAPPLSKNAGNQEQAFVEREPETPSAPAPLEMERLEIDQIDWEVKGTQDWDALISDADPAFLGMSYQEAKKRGLLDDLDADE